MCWNGYLGIIYLVIRKALPDIAYKTAVGQTVTILRTELVDYEKVSFW
jgi:hypothetical protein